MKRIALFVAVAGCLLCVKLAFGDNCPIPLPLCCHCLSGHKVGACSGGAVSGSCSCVEPQNGGCTSKGVCGMCVCICCGLADQTGINESLFGPTGSGTAPSCMLLQRVLQSSEDAVIKPMQLKQRWLRSSDLIANLATYSRTVSAFVQWHKDAILSERVTWGTKYEGKWDSDPKDDNAAWGTFEVEWNDKAIVFDKLQFHNVETVEPDRLIVNADGVWTMFKGESIFASGTWKAEPATAPVP